MKTNDEIEQAFRQGYLQGKKKAEKHDGENNKNAFLKDFQELLKEYNISEMFINRNGAAVFVSNGIPFEVVMYQNGRFLVRNEYGKFIIQHD